MAICMHAGLLRVSRMCSEHWEVESHFLKIKYAEAMKNAVKMSMDTREEFLG